MAPMKGDPCPVTREQHLREVVETIARMKIYPDDKINRMTLLAAIHLATGVLNLLD